VESLLLRIAPQSRGQSSYTDEYYDRFYNLAAGSLIRQLSDASTDVGSYWLTAWINAGKPPLPIERLSPPAEKSKQLSFRVPFAF